MSFIAEMMYKPLSDSEESKTVRDAINYYFLSNSISSLSGKVMSKALPSRIDQLQEENLMLDVMQKRKKMKLPLDERGLNEGSFPLTSVLNMASMVSNTSNDGLMNALKGAGRNLRYIVTGKGPLG